MHGQTRTLAVLNEAFARQQIAFPDAKVTGAQIVAATGQGPVEDFQVLQHLRSGELEDVRPTELVDLTDPGPEQVFVIRGSLSYSFFVDALSMRWPRKAISGKHIRLLARTPEDREIVLQRVSEPDRIIEEDDLVHLNEQGVERLVTRSRTFIIIVNGRRKTVHTSELSFDQVVALAFDNPPTGENIVFTVTYTNGQPPRPEGTLIKGQSVPIKNRMIFNVTATDKS
jgi:hypothetical protein